MYNEVLIRKKLHVPTHVIAVHSDDGTDTLQCLYCRAKAASVLGLPELERFGGVHAKCEMPEVA